jgi:molybdopterin-dependent oxidoreductase alpha subunit
LQKAKENGCIIISINPIPEAGLEAFNNPQTLKGALGIKLQLTDHYVQVKINGDMPFLQAVEKILLEEDEKMPGGVLDLEFIRDHTSGFADFKKHIQQKDLYQLSKQCGIAVDEIRKIAGVLSKKKKIIACWAMGLTQHKNAVDSIKEIVNLLLLKGSIGKEGSGTCPVRGHSNVQGDRTMGIYEKPSLKLLDALEKTYDIKMPRKHGYDTVESIHAMKEGKVKVFMAMGGNFISAVPDTKYSAEAIRQCKLTVHISTKLNRSHLVPGEESLILPTLARSDKDLLNGKEQMVSTENSMGVVQLSKGNLNPVSDHLLSESVIVCRMAKAVLGKEAGNHWNLYEKDYDFIRNDISRTIPGFENYNERIRKTGGFYLPNLTREKIFSTKEEKAIFNLSDFSELQLQEDEYLMMTIRSHDQFNTTIYGLNDRYRGIVNERRVIFMNEQDLEKAGFKNKDIVDLYNYDDGKERVARRFIIIAYAIPEKCTATYFPETNVLVPISKIAEKSNTPISKSVVIKIRKSYWTSL